MSFKAKKGRYYLIYGLTDRLKRVEIAKCLRKGSPSRCNRTCPRLEIVIRRQQRDSGMFKTVESTDTIEWRKGMYTQEGSYRNGSYDDLIFYELSHDEVLTSVVLESL